MPKGERNRRTGINRGAAHYNGWGRERIFTCMDDRLRFNDGHCERKALTIGAFVMARAIRFRPHPL